MTKFLRYLLSLAILAFALCFSVAVPAYAAPGTRVYSIFTYKNIAGAATTTVKSGAGQFHGFCINTVGTTVVFFDNTAGSGTKIASWTSTAIGCYLMDVQFTVGLTAVTVGTSDITVMYT
jgi:hypothetical protein